jgi:hypothetical protein
MFTVFLQGADRGVGMGYEEFVSEFEHICEVHVREKKARAFAFVLYDMTHGSVRKALKSERGYQILNEASGKDLTLFYLHSEATRNRAKQFNDKFLEALNVNEQIAPPCIVFFRISGKNIEDVALNSIDAETEDLYLLVEEMRRHIVSYVEGINEQGNLSGLTWIASGGLVGLLRAASRM